VHLYRIYIAMVEINELKIAKMRTAADWWQILKAVFQGNTFDFQGDELKTATAPSIIALPSLSPHCIDTGHSINTCQLGQL
jgi:hypothetical protein